MRFKTNLEIPILDRYNNTRCSYDGKYWYLSFGFEQGENQVPSNPKSQAVMKLIKKLKRLQRQASRKYEMNKEGLKFIKTSNIIKLERKIKLIHRKLTNIRQNHIHQATSMIIKMRPYRVVMEDLNISGMMKSRHLSRAIGEQKFYEFIRQMKYKCELNLIDYRLFSWFMSMYSMYSFVYRLEYLYQSDFEVR